MSSRLEAFSSEVKQTDNGMATPSIVSKPDPVNSTGNNLTSSSQDLRDKLAAKKGSSAFPRKIFQMRPSILTELLEVSHIRSIRQIFISILVILVLQVAITDLFELGTYVPSPRSAPPSIFRLSIDFRFDIIRWNFSNLSECFYLWLCLFTSTCTIVYYSFHFWAHKRLALISPDSSDKATTTHLRE